jgi:FkbM family methyltransferase
MTATIMAFETIMLTMSRMLGSLKNTGQMVRRQFYRPLKKPHGLWQVAGHTFYGAALSEQSVVVDLGASEGGFAHHVSTRFGCTIHSVEPSPRLVKSIPVSNQIHIHNFAISNHDGEATFFESSNVQAGTIVGKKPNTTGDFTVQCKTLETLMGELGLQSIDVLKVDIEGAEVQLFASVQDETLKNINQILLEFHDSVRYPNISSEDVRIIVNRLNALGFVGAPMGRKNLDWLFVNENKLTLPVTTKDYLQRKRQRF